MASRCWRRFFFSF